MDYKLLKIEGPNYVVLGKLVKKKRIKITNHAKN